MHIELRNVSHEFELETGFLPVLENLSFSVPKGKFTDLDDFSLNASSDEIVGLIKGIKLGVKRILKCHPFEKLGGSHGLDFVPISKDEKESNNG